MRLSIREFRVQTTIVVTARIDIAAIIVNVGGGRLRVLQARSAGQAVDAK